MDASVCLLGQRVVRRSSENVEGDESPSLRPYLPGKIAQFGWSSCACADASAAIDFLHLVAMNLCREQCPD